MIKNSLYKLLLKNKKEKNIYISKIKKKKKNKLSTEGKG